MRERERKRDRETEIGRQVGRFMYRATLGCGLYESTSPGERVAAGPVGRVELEQ
jgi:hypothetical protein